MISFFLFTNNEEKASLNFRVLFVDHRLICLKIVVKLFILLIQKFKLHLAQIRLRLVAHQVQKVNLFFFEYNKSLEILRLALQEMLPTIMSQMGISTDAAGLTGEAGQHSATGDQTQGGDDEVPGKINELIVFCSINSVNFVDLVENFDDASNSK